MSSISVDVDVNLYDFDDDDLIDELEGRGYIVTKANRPTLTEYALDSLATEMLVASTNKDNVAIDRCVQKFIEMVLDKRV